MRARTRLAISCVLSVVCSIGSIASGQTRPLVEDLPRQVLPLFRDLEGGGVGSLGIVGDSVSLLNRSYNWHLRGRFWADYGSAGDGYLALAKFAGDCGANSVGPRCGLGLVYGPGSTFSEDTGPFDSAGESAPDGMWFKFERIIAPGYSTFQAFGREVIVHYVRQVGGGVMEIDVAGNLFATIDTAIPAGEPQHARLVIDTGAAGPDVLTSIRIRNEGAQPVQVNAFEMRDASPGLRYHRLARGGAGPLQFLASRTDAVADCLRSLDMQLLIIMLDASGAELNNVAFYESNLDQLVSFYQAQLPSTKIILMTHHPFRALIGPQADAILRVARARGTGYINLFDLFSGFDEMNALGYMNGVVHLSNAGGAWFGEYIYGVLRTAAADALIADFNGDGLFDFFDVQAFLAAFAANLPAADVNSDGVLDFFDVQRFLAALSQALG